MAGIKDTAGPAEAPAASMQQVRVLLNAQFFCVGLIVGTLHGLLLSPPDHPPAVSCCHEARPALMQCASFRVLGLPYNRACFAHPGKTWIFKRLPTPCTGGQSVVVGLAPSFSQHLDFVLFWLSHAVCPIFECAEPTHNYFQNLPKILRTLKKFVQGPCTPCWQSISRQIQLDRTVV